MTREVFRKAQGRGHDLSSAMSRTGATAVRRLFLFYKVRICGRQLVGVPRDPNVEAWQEENADKEHGHQTTNDHNGKRALRIGTDLMRHGRGHQPERVYQHCHQNRAKTKHSTVLRRIQDRITARAKLVDVLHHDHAGLHGDAKANTLVDFARRNQVTQIFLTRPRRETWSLAFSRDPAQRVIGLAKDMLIVIVSDREPVR
jgi:hypothetical protein